MSARFPASPGRRPVARNCTEPRDEVEESNLLTSAAAVARTQRGLLLLSAAAVARTQRGWLLLFFPMYAIENTAGWTAAYRSQSSFFLSASLSILFSQGGRTLHLIAAVLHLRGESLCAQPAEDACGNVLLWNGEVRICIGWRLLFCLACFSPRCLSLRQPVSYIRGPM